VSTDIDDPVMGIAEDEASCGSFGAFLEMLVEDHDPETPAVFDDESERYAPLAEQIEAITSLVGSQGLTGTLGRFGTFVREGVRYAAGSFLLELGPFQLSKWLPRIMHEDADDETYVFGRKAKAFDVLLKRDQAVHRYNGMQVAQAVLRATGSISEPEQQILQALITVVGLSEDVDEEWPDPKPVLPDDSEPFWLLGDSYFRLGDEGDETEYPVDTFNLLIDHNMQLIPRNSLTLQCIRSAGRDVRLQFPTPLTVASNAALYQQRYDGRVEIEFSPDKNLGTGSQSTIFEFPRVIQQRRTPTTSGRNEIPLAIDLTAFMTMDGDDEVGEMIVTNILDSGSS
jgi:hypothetical protein